MKITKVDIPRAHDNRDGLGDIKMQKLQNLVLIAGKNGAGKSRILNKIFNIYRDKPGVTEISRRTWEIKEGIKKIQSHQHSINDLRIRYTQTTHNKGKMFINDSIGDHEKQIRLNKESIKTNQERLDWSYVETDYVDEQYVHTPFVPKNLSLDDSNNFSPAQLTEYSNYTNIVGVSMLPSSVFAKIQFVQNRWFQTSHQESFADETEKIQAKADYEKLKEIVKFFLNTSITRTVDGEAMLFGLPLGKSNLSDGQKVLLQFCLAIYSQEAALKDMILVLDEPENHLHTSILIETIEKLKSAVTNGQIWIATHSVPLLAHFDPSLIWFVEDNKIEHAGKIPEKVLHSLLGGENGLGKLQDFINLPAQYATSRFAFECLFEPSAVTTGSEDPQSYQIREALLKISNGHKLRVLDYGAGKGRVISNIVDLDSENQEKLTEQIDYIAFDVNNNDRILCEEAISKAYGSAEKRCFNDLSSLLSQYDKGSFHVVIMCNVLHEIDPKEWLRLFQKDGTISKLLSEDGVLLLVEDHQMPIGEMAYQKGFLVLDTPQLKELFEIKEADSSFVISDHDSKGRLKAHQIAKKSLLNISAKTRIDAINSLSDIAKGNILSIRNSDKDYKNGKLHGFWTQQFANAQLNLAELGP